MIPNVTVITPVASYHQHLIQRVQDAVAMQSVPCKHMVVVDSDWRGAGWARNRGIEKAAGADFFVFLDADDWIEPTFIERCLSVWRPGSYVYTDWYRGQDVIAAPDKPWRADGSWHVITALIPAQAVIDADGFDETLRGGEDSILYWTLTRAGCCGIHLQEPLFHYGHEGQRAKEFVHNEQAYNDWKRTLLERFAHQMGCCGDNNSTPEINPQDSGMPGDILAQAIWAGNRQERGLATGRLYERAGNGKRVWVDPRDVQIAPHLWRAVVEDKPAATRLKMTLDAPSVIPVAHGVQEIAQRLFPNAQPSASEIESLASFEPVGRGDVRKVLGLAKRNA